MSIHLLDLVMYVVILVIIILLLPREYKEELGAVAGFLICVVYTIVYTVLFWFFFDWSNILQDFTINVTW